MIAASTYSFFARCLFEVVAPRGTRHCAQLTEKGSALLRGKGGEGGEGGEGGGVVVGGGRGVVVVGWWGGVETLTTCNYV